MHDQLPSLYSKRKDFRARLRCLKTIKRSMPNLSSRSSPLALNTVIRSFSRLKATMLSPPSIIWHHSLRETSDKGFTWSTGGPRGWLSALPIPSDAMGNKRTAYQLDCRDALGSRNARPIQRVDRFCFYRNQRSGAVDP